MGTYVVGLLHLSERQTFTQTFETAAWYQEVIVEPGDYPVTASWWQGHWYFSATLPGIKGGSNFDSLLCGVPVSTNRDQGKGDPTTYPYSLGRDYDLAYRLLRQSLSYGGGDVIVTVDPDLVQLEVEPYVGTHHLDLGRKSDHAYEHLYAEHPNWRVSARVVVNTAALREQEPKAA